MANEEITNAKCVIRIKDWANITLPNLNLSLEDEELGDFVLNILPLIDLGEGIPELSLHKSVYSTIESE